MEDEPHDTISYISNDPVDVMEVALSSPMVIHFISV